MKKSLFVAAIAAISLVACKKGEATTGADSANATADSTVAAIDSTAGAAKDSITATADSAKAEVKAAADSVAAPLRNNSSYCYNKRTVSLSETVFLCLIIFKKLLRFFLS